MFNKTVFIISLISLMVSCKKTVVKEAQIVHKKYGKWEYISDSLSVELQIENFKNYKELVERVERIKCNDSFPKLVLRKGDEIKSIYFQNFCYENYRCVLIKQRNTIQIYKDSIIKNDLFYPMDSLVSILKKDLENFGKVESLCDNPEKLFIYISLNKNWSEKLPYAIDKLTEAYDEVSNNRGINIILEEWIEFANPLHPPVELVK